MENNLMSDKEFRVATEEMECNASMFIKDCLDEILPDLTDEQIEAVELARVNNWRIQPGETYRFYVWDKGGTEEADCNEIPAMAEICTELDLWP